MKWDTNLYFSDAGLVVTDGGWGHDIKRDSGKDGFNKYFDSVKNE